MPQPRVLVIAEAANPEWVSVPLIGWSLSQSLNDVADVHLVTHVRNRQAVLSAGLKEGEDFTAIDAEAVTRPLWKVSTMLTGNTGRGWTTSAALANVGYYYFESLVWKEFNTRLKAGEFDLVHRITPLSPTTPSLIARSLDRINVPFVVGPLNGGAPWPKGYDHVRRQEGEWLSYVRAGYRLLPGIRSMRERAAAILIGSRATYAQEPPHLRDKIVYLPENAVDPERFPPVNDRRWDLPVRLVFIGRLVPLKGVHLLVEAVRPLAKEGRIVVDVLGDGPQMAELRQLTADIRDSVRLRGWVDHRELQSYLGQAHVLGFPSIKDFGGGVVLEAMATGVVPIVMDYAGPSELVTQATGFALPMGPPASIVEGLRRVLTRLVSDPGALAAMSEAARDRVATHFTWQRKAEQVRAVYDWVLGTSPTKPDFGMPLGEFGRT